MNSQLHTKFSNQPIPILIDSGANLSAINQALVTKWKLLVEPPLVSIKLGNGATMFSKGVTSLTLYLFEQEITWKFYVVSGLPTSLVFGTDLLKDRQAKLDFGSAQLSFLDDQSESML